MEPHGHVVQTARGDLELRDGAGVVLPQRRRPGKREHLSLGEYSNGRPTDRGFKFTKALKARTANGSTRKNKTRAQVKHNCCQNFKH